jgi:hypothetical protein
MPNMRVVLDGDGAFPEYLGRPIIEAEITAMTALPRGTVGDNPTVAFFIELPPEEGEKEGKVIFAQSTMKIMLTACDAFVARYGDPRK